MRELGRENYLDRDLAQLPYTVAISVLHVLAGCSTQNNKYSCQDDIVTETLSGHSLRTGNMGHNDSKKKRTYEEDVVCEMVQNRACEGGSSTASGTIASCSITGISARYDPSFCKTSQRRLHN